MMGQLRVVEKMFWVLHAINDPLARPPVCAHVDTLFIVVSTGFSVSGHSWFNVLFQDGRSRVAAASDIYRNSSYLSGIPVNSTSNL